MKPEIFFIKYAFPCAYILLERKEISEVELKELENAAIKSIVLPRAKLEKYFFRAFKKIKPIAKDLGKDKWDIGVLKEYFINKHNTIIEKGMYAYAKAPETLKNLCKVHIAKIIDIKDNILIVKYLDKTRPVKKDLVKEAKIGDKVTIHYGYAIEII
jgi:hypothetical protein